MKASLLWLRELLGPAFVASAEETAERLTRAGLEVEAIHRFGEASASVVLARVVSKRPHPSRPKLTLVTVEAGRAPEEVVCGAPNVPAPGALVVLARVGTTLPAKGLTLEPKDIAGVESRGMLCSEGELGLRQSGGDAGILVLDASLGTPGTPLSRAIPESCDEVLEISLTPNRPDGLGHVGLARELAALLDLPFQRPTRTPRAVDATLSVDAVVRVEIAEPQRCPSYGAHLVRGVRVGPSPLGVQYRLEALGVRAISNVVDVTNLVMLEFGHPIHAFDRSRVRESAIVVRCATEGESFETLDGVTRTLSSDDLLICDGRGPVALAGVMGGQESGVSENTSEVVIECAYFEPRTVRRSARRHGMHTESSHRFERGVDPSDVRDVLGAAAAKVIELGGGAAAPEALVVGPGVSARGAIALRPERATSLLGLAIPEDRMRSILARLGCEELSKDGQALRFVPPPHRPDLTLEEDLVEEIVRVFGVDRVPSVLPAIRPGEATPASNTTARVARAAQGVGLSQALTFAFTSKRHLAALGLGEGALALKNPLSDDRTEMRTSLLPGLFDAVARARRYGVRDVRLFSVGARFLQQPGEKLPREARSFAAVLAGDREAVLAKPEPCDVYDAKGVALEIVQRATNRSARVVRTPEASRPRYGHPRASGDVFVGDTLVGRFGVLHPVVERELELDGTVVFVELDVDALDALGVATPRYATIPTLPASTRDLAFTVDEGVESGAIEAAILEAAGDLAESVALFDLFRGKNLGVNKKSLAYRVVYRDPNARRAPDKARTLTDAEVDARQAAVEAALKQRFGAELRA
jgi:phenylalanyl-tRNA synthetase beta chain